MYFICLPSILIFVLVSCGKTYQDESRQDLKTEPLIDTNTKLQGHWRESSSSSLTSEKKGKQNQIFTRTRYLTATINTFKLNVECIDKDVLAGKPAYKQLTTKFLNFRFSDKSIYLNSDVGGLILQRKINVRSDASVSMFPFDERCNSGFGSNYNISKIPYSQSNADELQIRIGQESLSFKRVSTEYSDKDYAR